MFPAKDFESLRQQVLLIRQGEIELDVGKKSLKSLALMIEEPDLVALNNIVHLAEKASISPASITRLCRLLGFKGFSEFQQVFKQRAKNRSDYYTQKLQSLVANRSLTSKQLLRNQAEHSLKNIDYCLNHIDDKSLQTAQALLALSRRIYVFGHKQSSAIANILKYGLSLIRYDVHRLQQAEHGAAIAVGQLRKNDLLVIISSSPYAGLTLEIASLAKKQQCKIIAITDSEISPLCDFSTLSLIVPTEGLYYNNSLSACVILIESLLSLTAIELGDSAINKLNSHEITLMQLKDSH